MINDFPPTVTSVSADANTPAAASTALFTYFLPITASVLLMEEHPYAKIKSQLVLHQVKCTMKVPV